MKKPTKPTEQTPEDKFNEVYDAAEAKAKIIGDNLNPKCKVYPIVLYLEAEKEYVVGFARKPDMATQLRLIDKSDGRNGIINMEIGDKVMRALIVTEECDKRIVDENEAYYDQYWKGAVFTLATFMGVATPLIKKK